MQKKLAYSEQVKGELKKQTELLRQVLEDKEKEITDTKNQLCQAKEEAVREYRDSDAFLAELEGTFAEGFDNALRQVKNSYTNLDVSHVTIETQDQSTAQLVLSESTEDLFADDAIVNNAIVNLQSYGIVDLEGQEKTAEEGTHHLEDVQVMEKDDVPTVQQWTFFFFNFM